MSNNDEIVSQLARYLLKVNQGERLQSVRAIATAYGASVGTISNALTSIEEAGAVRIDRRGHTGSFILERNLGLLWSLAEREPIVIAFPLLSNTRLEGLATALKHQISEVGIDVYMIFVRGSRTRMKLLRENKCHIAVLSEFAAMKLSTATEQVILQLPAHSYVELHKVFCRVDMPAPGKPLRVAIDPDSLDIQALTQLEFEGQNVEFYQATFMQLPRLLKNGTVDAGVWSIDDMVPHLDNHIWHRPLSEHVVDAVGYGDTSATLLVQASNESIHALTQAVLSNEAIIEIQRGVMAGEIVPTY